MIHDGDARPKVRMMRNLFVYFNGLNLYHTYMTNLLSKVEAFSELLVSQDSGILKLEIEETRNYYKVVRVFKSLTRSVVCFIAKSDGATKAFGEYKEGDIFKAASWNSPAKGIRGNVFNDDGGFSATNGKGSIRYNN